MRRRIVECREELLRLLADGPATVEQLAERTDMRHGQLWATLGVMQFARNEVVIQGGTVYPSLSRMDATALPTLLSRLHGDWCNRVSRLRVDSATRRLTMTTNDGDSKVWAFELMMETTHECTLRLDETLTATLELRGFKVLVVRTDKKTAAYQRQEQV